MFANVQVLFWMYLFNLIWFRKHNSVQLNIIIYTLEYIVNDDNVTILLKKMYFE